MSKNKILIIHAGDMDNKGSEALLRSDVSVIKKILDNNVDLSVSAVNVQSIKDLNLPLKSVLPPVVDIPYKNADALAKKLGINRSNFRYKILSIASLILMLIQLELSIISSILVKLGLPSIYRRELFDTIKKCNLVISCSDENFKEAASLLPTSFYWIVTWWTMLFQRTFEMSVAKFIGKPIVLFPNSVGPFKTVVGKFFAKMALNNFQYTLIREPFSFDITESLQIGSRKMLTSDVALLFKTPKTLPLGLFKSQVVCVCPGIYRYSCSEKQVNDYISAHANALDLAIEKHGLNVIFSPHYVSGLEFDDMEVCKLILEKMKNKKCAKIVVANGVEEFKSILDNMDMLIASKMHPGVLALSNFVPTLCIAYDHKQTGLFKQLAMENCVIPITECSSEKLSQKIDYIWENRAKIVFSLQLRVPELQQTTLDAITKTLSPFCSSVSKEPILQDTSVVQH